MTDLINKVVFEIPPTLRVLNSLPLPNDLQVLFSPFAKETVVLLDEIGSWITAKVNKQATFLKGANLVDFFEAQGYLRLELSHMGENYFRVIPIREMLEHNLEHNLEQPTNQLSFDFLVAGQEPQKPISSQGKTEHKPIQEPLERAKEKPKTIESHTFGEKMQTQHTQVEKEGKQRTTVPMKKDPMKSDLKGKNREKVLTKDPSAAKVNKPLQPISIPADRPSILPDLPENISIIHQPVKVLKPPSEHTLLSVVFHTAEDAQVLERVKAGHFSRTSDFYLRQRALQLSVSPGFETLMSLQAARHLQPLDYQLRTVRHVLMNLRGRALLCDEVGMGKTVEAGLITLEYILRGLVRRVLVLSPPSLVEQWQEEMRSKFNLDFIVYDSAEFKAHPNPWATFPRIIASIDTAKRGSKQEQILAVPYDLVIVDEAHHLKKQRSQAYQLVSQLKKKYILLLTATPVENDLEELFNLITLLFPGQLETAASFKRKYITRGDPLKPKNTETLKQLIREVMVRNRRSETGAIACRRSADMIRIELTPEEKAFYQRLTVFVRVSYRVGVDKDQTEVHAFVLKILQREAGSSIEAVLPTLKKMAANQDYPESLRGVLTVLARQAGNVPRRAKVETLLKLLPRIQGKVIIFTSFTETQHYLVQTLRTHGLLMAELHSGLRRQEKEEQVRLFAGDVDILVSTETGSEGRNLQFANNIINYDLPWNPMRIEQRIGRIHRIGQERDVHIYNFSAVDTIEAHILEILDAKINMFQLVVGELDMILGDLTEKRDFEDLIMDIWARSDNDESLKLEMEELGDRLVVARDHYLAVKELDDRLLGELAPEEGE
ncbi:DEAD/DEAH box helicase [Desulfosporosinus sp. BICA1-9]|uniref:DEAD/DEAH box helicase n=1 Tax=Desulfosporosinus sp. BICA1-9 TaxID=1531958 RepID=UPI000A66F6FF|nr:SNF2-related protein [Desulfosporosinus sp. BICA1-9]